GSHTLGIAPYNGAGAGTMSTTPVTIAPPPPTVPSAPVLTIATPGDGEVALAWTEGLDGGSAITSFTLLRGTSPGSETSHITGISSAARSYIDNTSVTNGTTYYYKLVAINAVGSSGGSNEKSDTPDGAGLVISEPTI